MKVDAHVSFFFEKEDYPRPLHRSMHTAIDAHVGIFFLAKTACPGWLIAQYLFCSQPAYPVKVRLAA